MKISRTDAFQRAAVGGPGFLLVFVDEAGGADRWLLLDNGGVAGRGEGEAPTELSETKRILVVPGSQVTVHWLELAEGLTDAQAAAAARLMLADSTVEPIAETHLAVGRRERGLTPVALVSAERMGRWLAEVDADRIVPSHMLLPVPDEGLVRRVRGGVADYRGPATAFTLEPELAEIVADGGAAMDVDEVAAEAALTSLLADPPLDLRQGRFARRRNWQGRSRDLRRIGWLVLALAVLSLAVEVAAILGYTFAADRFEAEARALASRSGAERHSFSATATLLFDSLRAIPNVEMTRLQYREDGSIEASVIADNAATLAALRSRLEASGLSVESGEPRSAGGRPAVDLKVRTS